MNFEEKVYQKPQRPKRAKRDPFKKLSKNVSYTGGVKLTNSGRETIPEGKGVMKFTELGFSVEGTFKSGIVQGRGHIYFSKDDDRDFGEGHISMSKLNGTGTLVFKDDKWYIGELEENQMTGQGTMYKDGRKYFSGDFKNGEIAGSGTMYLSEGWRLTGNFEKGIPSPARIDYGPDNFYEGEIDTKRLIPHGIGVRKMRTVSDDISFIGEFVGGKLEGRGIMKFQGGNEYYQGTFRSNMKHGKGVYKFRNGDFYSGDFKDDYIDGLGEMTFAQGNIYFGMFENGNLHGKGRLKFGSKHNSSLKVLQYIGYFENNKMQPKGKLFYADGSVYEGSFLDGKAHGKGIYTFPLKEGGDKLPIQYNHGKVLSPDVTQMFKLLKTKTTEINLSA